MALEKEKKGAGVRMGVATAVMAGALTGGCGPVEREGNQSEDINDQNARSTEVVDTEQVQFENEQLRMLPSSFGGSRIEKRGVVGVEAREELNLGVDRLNRIMELAREEGMKDEEIAYIAFDKLSAEGEKETVLLLAVPSEEDPSMGDLYYVTGIENSGYVPVEGGSDVELIEMRQYVDEEDESRLLVGFELEEGDFLPVFDLSEGVYVYYDPYTDSAVGMEENVGKKVLASLNNEETSAISISEHLETIVGANERFSIRGEELYWDEVSLGNVSEISETTGFQETERGVLLAVDQARTEELQMEEGDYWVDYIVTKNGERITIPEPQVGLPESYEETNMVEDGWVMFENAQVRGYFVANLRALEEKHIRENGIPENECVTGMVSDAPWSRTDFREGDIRGNDLGILSWTRIDIGGKVFDLVGLSFELDANFGDRDGERITMHVLYDSRSTWKNRLERGFVDNSEEGMERAETFYVSSRMFERLSGRTGDYFMQPRLMVSEEDGQVLNINNYWNELIKILKYLDARYDYSDAQREAVWRSSNKNPQATDDLMEALENEMLPVYGF